MRQLYIYGVFLALACTACSERVAVPEVDSAPAVISFQSFIREGDQVRPISKAVGGDLASGFMLGGSWSTPAFLTATPAQKTEFVKDRHLNSNGTDVDANAPKLFWKADGATYNSFYAYSANPTGTPAGSGVTQAILGGGNTHVQVVFKQLNDPAKQIDLLTAESLDHKVGLAAPSGVNLYFEHRLARVRIRAYGNGTVTIKNCQGSISYSAASAPMSSSAGLSYVKWKGAYVDGASTVSHTGTFNLGDPFMITPANVNGATATIVGDMIFIPGQTLIAGWATLSISYTVEASTTVKTASLELPALSLAASKQYDINVFLSEHSKALSVSNVSLTDWTSESSLVDQL